MFIPPRYRGVSDQASPDAGRGSGGREWGVGDAARTSHPAVQAAHDPGVPAARRDPADGWQAGGRSEASLAEVPGSPRWSVTRNGQRAGVTNGSTTGDGAEQTLQTPRAGRLGFGGLAVIGLRQASMSRGVEARGSEHACLRTLRKLVCARTPGVPRALGSFPGDAHDEMQAAPGACPKIRAMTLACSLNGCLKSELPVGVEKTHTPPSASVIYRACPEVIPLEKSKAMPSQTGWPGQARP